MSLDFIGKYNSWERVDPAELFSATTEKKEATPKLRMPEFLASEAVGCDYLVLWLDCDKEGENICFEVLAAVQSSMSRPPPDRQTIFRARFSAITDRDIRAAMSSLVEPDENAARSVDARQELDLRVGCAFTRFQTRLFQGKYGDLDSTLISYGPCQTPTLGFCVERHDQIQSFQPEQYWKLALTCDLDGGQQIDFEWARVRCFDKEVASMFLNQIKDIKSTVVDSVVSKEKTKARPQALNTVELMRVASSGLNMSPHYAMQIAERLYTQGYISYPRTETTQYPENFDLLGAVRQQRDSAVWGEQVRALLEAGLRLPRRGVDAGDHPPITPMRLASRHALDDDSWRIYDYVVRHFIATVHRDCSYLSTTVTVRLGGQQFTATGTRLLDAGFTELMDWLAVGRAEPLPQLAPADLLNVSAVALTDHYTSPPGYLTEAELITLMEKHGIGTDASIPVHINNIGLRNYVTVETGRRLVPTTLGNTLVHGYQKIDPDLVLPTMRSAVEQQLNLIALGKADFHSVLTHTLNIFKQKFHFFVKNISYMDQLFEDSFSPLASSGKPLSRCGRCRRYMRLVESRPQRLHCQQCGHTLALPADGLVRVYNESKCPLDEFELVVWSGGKKGRSFVLCPYCYNHPPFPDMGKGSGCNSCSHPSCRHGVSQTGVSACSCCERGVLTLDPSSAPRWKLVCNRCDVVVSAFDQASLVAVMPDVCEQCGAYLVRVEYRPEKSRLPNRAAQLTGCAFCTAGLTQLVQLKHAQRSGGRPRGGQRGRGRGGGPDQPRRDKMAELAAFFM
ncbi:DNA topoisomerase 3-beta-1 [Amphibalanus amphitrite]|uniref:DNA topoisomerase n=1 Tax=Amphibalanus amphitrite TaxID=1232801 RepID=A0A6A4WXP6_AMPAM|nr:DNA topoisomerase 3-beta-1 [Amphibalanus amphitrite]